MEKIVNVKHLQNSGLLGAEYTGLDLCDSFLMYWISHSGTDQDPIVLHYGNYTLDIDGYFRMFGDLVETPNSLRNNESLLLCASVWENKNKSLFTERHECTKKDFKTAGKKQNTRLREYAAKGDK